MQGGPGGQRRPASQAYLEGSSLAIDYTAGTTSRSVPVRTS